MNILRPFKVIRAWTYNQKSVLFSYYTKNTPNSVQKKLTESKVYKKYKMLKK